jgi:hypothetical protein
MWASCSDENRLLWIAANRDASEWFSFCQFCEVAKVLIIQKKK